MKKSVFKILSLILLAGSAECGAAMAADPSPAFGVPGGAFILPTANVVTAAPADSAPVIPSITALDATVTERNTFIAPGASSTSAGSTSVDANSQLRNERISLDPPNAYGSGAVGVYEPNAIPTSRGMAQPGGMGPNARTLDSNTSGRVINNSYSGDWFDYCGPRGNGCCSQLYFAADMWLMDRKDATLKQIAVSSTTGLTALNTADPNFRWDQVASRLTVGRVFCDWAVEGNILYIDDISAHADSQATTVGNNAVFFGLQPVGSNYTGTIATRLEMYDGLHSYEINAIDTRSFFQMIYGFRYIEFREHLLVTSTSGTGTSTSDIGTYNRMFGGQIGLRMEYVGDFAHWEFNVKGGLYQNDANIGTTIRDLNNTTTLRGVHQDGQNEAYEAEATVAANFRLTNSLKARIGYQVMYIGEIALAPDQIDSQISAAASRTGLLNDAKGDMFLRGFTAGLEYRW